MTCCSSPHKADVASRVITTRVSDLGDGSEARMKVVSDAKMIGVRCRHPRLIVTYYFVFDGALNKETKVRLMRALVWPVATYGCELWTLKASDFDKKRIAGLR